MGFKEILKEGTKYVGSAIAGAAMLAGIQFYNGNYAQQKTASPSAEYTMLAKEINSIKDQLAAEAGIIRIDDLQSQSAPIYQTPSQPEAANEDVSPELQAARKANETLQQKLDNERAITGMLREAYTSFRSEYNAPQTFDLPNQLTLGGGAYTPAPQEYAKEQVAKETNTPQDNYATTTTETEASTQEAPKEATEGVEAQQALAIARQTVANNQNDLEAKVTSQNTLERAQIPAEGLNLEDARAYAKQTGYDPAAVIAAKKAEAAKAGKEEPTPEAPAPKPYGLSEKEALKYAKQRVKELNNVEGNTIASYNGDLTYEDVQKPYNLTAAEATELGQEQHVVDSYERVTKKTVNEARKAAKQRAKAASKASSSSKGSNNGSSNTSSSNGSSDSSNLEDIVEFSMGQDDFNVDVKSQDYHVLLTEMGISHDQATMLFALALNNSTTKLGEVYQVNLQTNEDSKHTNVIEKGLVYRANSSLDHADYEVVAGEFSRLIRDMGVSGTVVETNGQEFAKLVEDYITSDPELAANLEQQFKENGVHAEDIRQRFHELAVAFSRVSEYNLNRVTKTIWSLEEGILTNNQYSVMFGTEKQLDQFFRGARQ